MLKKIILLLTITLFTCSITYAYDIPIDFHKNSEYFYSNGDYGLTITKYNSKGDSWLFNNDTDYIIHEGDNHIWNYTDKLTKQVGVLELTADGDVVEIYCNGSDIDKCYNYLMEFNKLNNVKPAVV